MIPKKIPALFLFLTLVVCPLQAADKTDKNKIERAPEFSKKGVWLNVEHPLTRKVFNDRLTLVYFWDYTSINCIREMRVLKKWYELYHPYGLDMIWVHAPEFQFAADEREVQRAVERFQITFPIFLDNDFKLWEAYHVRSWPTKVLINGKGEVVWMQVGEEKYARTEKRIRAILEREINPGSVLPPAFLKKEPNLYSIKRCGLMTAETYIGYKRATWWGAKVANRHWVPSDRVLTFKDYGERPDKGFFVEGMWANHEDSLEHARETTDFADYLGMTYVGNEVYAVLSRSPFVESSRVYVTRDEIPVPRDYWGKDLREDGEGGTYFLVRDSRMYYLIAGEDDELHEIKLFVRTPGIAIHSFSFSNRCLGEFEHL